jgi:hypothetical protein
MVPKPATTRVDAKCPFLAAKDSCAQSTKALPSSHPPDMRKASDKASD